MVEYLKKTQEWLQSFKESEVIHIAQGLNKKVDALSKLAFVAFYHLAKDVKVETIKQPSILEDIFASIEMPEPNWITPICQYLKVGIVLEDKPEARRLRIRALQYEIIDGILYRRSYLGPSLKCIDYGEAEYVIREIYGGICGMHMGAKMVAARAMRAGYYWPTMFMSPLKEIRKCDGCQIYAPVTRKPKPNLVPVSSSWSFQKWGIDIVGPFLKGSGKAKFLVVAINYFTKWVEAKPLVTITGQQVKRFVWENIACRFRLPYTIVSDNGKQFAGGVFREWQQSLWVEELPHVLWAHRTMPKISNGETPFNLTYGTEAMIPVKIGSPTNRMQLTEVENENDLRLNLNFGEERREMAARREIKYKKRWKNITTQE
ncbi:uncharacterized protein LOC143599702 [Bidens hawaiensis]|uniref:uncharacterized protein LOC143599702 n=1 Tax=Bidens hawaiensis TaxID=980011 RepID=UPI00404B9641